MNNMVSVSIIVPVFNVEKYIRRCLNSIIDQEFKDFEVLVLIDGSEDNSESIVDEFVSNDIRFKKLKHSNIGLGPTRNIGIKNANGKYLLFIDSDDYIDKSMVKTLFDEIERKDADIICCETLLLKKGTRDTRYNFEQKELVKLDKTNINKFMREYYYPNKYSHNAVDKIYKSSFIKENNIIFGDNKKIFAEDTFFQISLLSNLPKIGFIPVPLYYYDMREDSLMTSYKENLIDRNLRLLDALFEMYKKNSLPEDLLNIELVNLIISELLNNVENNKGYKKFRNSMETLRNWSNYKKTLKSIKKHRSFNLIISREKRIVNKLIFGLYEVNLNFLGDLAYYTLYRSMSKGRKLRLSLND